MKKHYSKDFKDEVVLRTKNGESVYQLAKEFDIGASTIYQWLKVSNDTTNVNDSLINLKGVLTEDLIKININGLEIKVDSLNLNKILKVIKN